MQQRWPANMTGGVLRECMLRQGRCPATRQVGCIDEGPGFHIITGMVHGVGGHVEAHPLKTSSQEISVLWRVVLFATMTNAPLDSRVHAASDSSAGS